MIVCLFCVTILHTGKGLFLNSLFKNDPFPLALSFNIANLKTLSATRIYFYKPNLF